MTKESEILEMFREIKSRHGGVDVCINNAGLGGAAPLLSGDTGLWKNMLDVSTCIGLYVRKYTQFRTDVVFEVVSL